MLSMYEMNLTLAIGISFRLAPHISSGFGNIGRAANTAQIWSKDTFFT